ncbi:MAG TPA: hypothetical protein VN282_21190 [Pyrinomonadaceae bacterium]|nr:hypothetical protein [Pyrinomonadaceae bacterium]
MGLLNLFVIISAIAVAGHAPQKAAGKHSNSHESVFEFYQFPSHPRLTHLCQRRIYSGSVHAITWDAFASPDKPSKLVAYYRRKLGNAGFTREGAGGQWSLPADAPRPERILEVSGVRADSLARECEKRPPPNSRAIILVSRLLDPRVVPAEPPPDYGMHPAADTPDFIYFQRHGAAGDAGR